MRATAAGLLLLLTSACIGARMPGLYDAAASSSPGQGGQSGERDARIADAPRDQAAMGGAGGAPQTGGSSGRGGSGGSGGVTTAACTEVAVAATERQPVDVLLVLDRSGSMHFNVAEECSCSTTSNPRVWCADTVNCKSRWTALVEALDSTLATAPFLYWGLKLFSSTDAGPCNVVAGVEVPVAAGTTSAIHDLIAATTPFGETPTASAILRATAYLATQSDPYNKVILLATDGKPNCGGSPPSVYEDDVPGATDAITAAAKAGFLVYVVGMGFGSVADNLDAFARAGGTGHHYPAQTPEALAAALAAISRAAACTIAVSAQPPGWSHIGVYLDKAMVAQDGSDGWTLGPSPQTVLLHGRACDRALAAPPDALKVLYGCGPPLPPVLP